MDLGLTGLRALVTGASDGIGLETARLLRAEGAAVAIASRDPAAAARAIGAAAVAYVIQHRVREPALMKTFERFARIASDTLTLQYLLSTWNPYTVVRMRSTLSITSVGNQQSMHSVPSL